MAKGGMRRMMGGGSRANRITPRLPSSAYKTYAISAPKSTHTRPATCQEYGCDAYLKGWQSFIDESSDLGQKQAYYIRKQSGRGFTEHRNEAGITVFTFEAGQRCFASEGHTVPLGKPEIFVVKSGDWRASDGLIRRHVRADDWVDDFANHQQGLADKLQKG